MKKEVTLPIDITTAESYTWGAQCTGWHLLNSNELSIIQESIPVGGSEILHYHKNVIQFFYILSGWASFQLEDVTHILKANQGIQIQPMQSHSIANHGTTDLSLLVISSPHSHSDRINITPF